jgi:hypothetical protein
MSGTEAQLVLPESKPLYPDVPWWSVLITALVCSAVAVIATAVALRSGVSVPSVGAATPGGLLVDTVVYMPHILLLFGVLADMFTYDGVWSIPSLVGVISIFLNFVFRFFWVGIDEMWAAATVVVTKGATSAAVPPTSGGAKGAFSKDYDGCSVQGFEGFASEYAPQTLVVTATVFSYYCFDIVQNRGWVNSIAAVATFMITYIAQVAIISMTNDGGCAPPPGRPPQGTMSQAVRALAEGLLFGGTSYGIVKTYYPTRLPSSTVSPFPRRTGADLTMGADGKMRDADGFPYVVLPNGQAVPDLSDKGSRMAFGKQAASTLGTGVPATAGCAADAAGGSVDDRLKRISALATV